MIKYYDRQGSMIDSDTWMRLHSDMDYRRIAEDTVGPYWISTVWLGLDHNFYGAGAPIIFETLVFAGFGVPQPMTDDMLRYSTEAAARRGHADTVTLCRYDLEAETPSD